MKECVGGGWVGRLHSFLISKLEVCVCVCAHARTSVYDVPGRWWFLVAGAFNEQSGPTGARINTRSCSKHVVK